MVILQARGHSLPIILQGHVPRDRTNLLSRRASPRWRENPGATGTGMANLYEMVTPIFFIQTINKEVAA